MYLVETLEGYHGRWRQPWPCIYCDQSFPIAKLTGHGNGWWLHAYYTDSGTIMGTLTRPIGITARHLCIDMQRLFSPEGPWPTPWMTRVLPVVEALAERAPQRTIFTRFIPPLRAEEMPGMWQAYYAKWREVTRENVDPSLIELMPSLKRFVPPAAVFDKMVYSAFANGALAARLEADRVEYAHRHGLRDRCLRTGLRARSRGSRLSRHCCPRRGMQFVG